MSMRGAGDSLNTPPGAHLQCLQSMLQAWHRQRPGQLGEHPKATVSGLLRKVMVLAGSLADEQQRACGVLLLEQGKAGQGWHGVVENQQVGTTLGTKARVEFSGVCADANVKDALGVEGLVQKNLVRWASLVDQHVGLVHEPLLKGEPANLGVVKVDLNRIFLRGAKEKAEVLGPLCGLSGPKAAPARNAMFLQERPWGAMGCDAAHAR